MANTVLDRFRKQGDKNEEGESEKIVRLFLADLPQPHEGADERTRPRSWKWSKEDEEAMDDAQSVSGGDSGQLGQCCSTGDRGDVGKLRADIITVSVGSTGCFYEITFKGCVLGTPILCTIVMLHVHERRGHSQLESVIRLLL